MNFNNLKIRNKIIISLSIISLLGSFGLYFYWTDLYQENRIDVMLSKAESIVHSAEAARSFIGEQNQHGIFKDSLTDIDDILHTVPIFSSLKIAQENADELGYKLKVPKISPRNPDNEPDAYELEVLAKLKKENLDDYWSIDDETNQLRYFRPVTLSEDCLICHGDPNNSMELWGNEKGLDVTGGRMEGWKAGEIHGAFEIMMDLEPMYAEIRNQSIVIFAITISLAIMIIIISIYISKKISKPIMELIDVSEEIAKGNIDVKIEQVSQDELGMLFKAYQNLIEYFKNQVKAIEEISRGHFDISLVPLSDKDVLSKSIIRVAGSLDSIVAETSKVIDNVKNGRLDIKGDTTRFEGDWTKLISGINGIIHSFGIVIVQITQSVDSVAGSAREISLNTDTIATSAEELNKQTNEVALAVDEMSRTIDENALATTDTDSVAQENGKVAQEGGEVVKLTIEKMQEIASVVEQSAGKISTLGKSSDAIGEIISVIEDIADQTNLLALNAAIEAARAGEQGRGFAVVADEVRKLAERTTEATKEISKMIKDIQGETSEAVKIMNVTNDEVKNGIQLADQAGNSLSQIVNSSQDLLDKIAQIASASEEQSSTSKIISQNVFSISEVTNDTVRRISDIANAISETSNLAKEIIDTLSRYKVDVNEEMHDDGDYMNEDLSMLSEHETKKLES